MRADTPRFNDALAQFRASADACAFEERQEQLERDAERAFAEPTEAAP